MKMRKRKPGPVYVAVYGVRRRYGGPEEGGWWYDEGTVLGVLKLARSEVRPVFAAPGDYLPARAFVRPQAMRRIEHLAARDFGYLRVKPKGYRSRSSVLGGEDVEIHYSRTVPQPFPQTTPHYE